MRRSLCICAAAALVALSCEIEQATPFVPGDRLSDLDRDVVENMLLVEAAAQAWAAEDGGAWPPLLTSVSSSGNTLLDLLPDGELLENPETGDETEPVFMEPGGIGSTSYRAYGAYDLDTYEFHFVGYMIEGRGEADDYFLTNLPDSILALEDSVLACARVVQQAVEAFAADNNSEYPYNGMDVNDAGKQVYDYLPDGMLMENPFTRARTNPTWGAAAAQFGEVGYVAAANPSSRPTGYVVDAIGSYYNYPVFEHYVEPAP